MNKLGKFQSLSPGHQQNDLMGKIMRRILRKIAHKDSSNLGDISTLLNPECVEDIIENAL